LTYIPTEEAWTIRIAHLDDPNVSVVLPSLELVRSAFPDKQQQRSVCVSGSTVTLWDLSTQNSDSIKRTMTEFSVKTGAELMPNGGVRKQNEAERLKAIEQLKPAH
jgi:hypothetical protein